jgi:hypothetical protein
LAGALKRNEDAIFAIRARIEAKFLINHRLTPVRVFICWRRLGYDTVVGRKYDSILHDARMFRISALHTTGTGM